MITTPTIDPAIAVPRPDQARTAAPRAAVRPDTGPTVSTAVPTMSWHATNGSMMSEMCAAGFAHLDRLGTDGIKPNGPGHLAGGLT